MLAFSFLLGIFVSVRLYVKWRCGKCHCTTRLVGKVAIVTGANSGIGYETAKDLAMRGAKVIIACRNVLKGRRAQSNLVYSTGNTNIIFKHLDLSRLNSIRRFAYEIIQSEHRLDLLINNAGTGKLDNSLTEDRLPVEAQVNHFGPFLLTLLLLPLMKISAPSRIISVSSVMHYLGKVDHTFDRPARNFLEHMRVYSNTKLANILFTMKLSRLLRGTGVTANCLHPGAINTAMFRDQYRIVKFILWLLFKTAEEGAQTTIHLAVAPDLETVSGGYFQECAEATPSLQARNRQLADMLWEMSMRNVARRMR